MEFLGNFGNQSSHVQLANTEMLLDVLRPLVDEWKSYLDPQQWLGPRIALVSSYLMALVVILLWKRKLVSHIYAMRLIILILLNLAHFGLVQIHYTVGQNSQESGRKYWANRSSVRSFACTAH